MVMLGPMINIKSELNYNETIKIFSTYTVIKVLDFIH